VASLSDLNALLEGFAGWCHD